MYPSFLDLFTLALSITSVRNPWLRHSNHPQEKEGGPKKNEKRKKEKKTPPFIPLPNKGHGFVTQGT
jgi:hypothetical protein